MRVHNHTWKICENECLHLTNVCCISVCAREREWFVWVVSLRHCCLTLIGVFRKVGGASNAFEVFCCSWHLPTPFLMVFCILWHHQWQHGTSYVSVLTWPWQVHVKPNTDPHKVIYTPRQAPTLELTSFVWTHSQS